MWPQAGSATGRHASEATRGLPRLTGVGAAFTDPADPQTALHDRRDAVGVPHPPIGGRGTTVGLKP